MEKRDEIIRTYKEQGCKNEIQEALKQLHWQVYESPASMPEDLCYLEGKYLGLELYVPVRWPEQEENEMFTMPTIDMVATGRNITRLREKAGLSVKDLAEIFGFATPQAVYK